MKYLIDKKLALVIIAACLLFLLHSKTAVRDDATAEDNYPANAAESVDFSPLRSNERVIYTCRMADEEIPAVQISEIADANGRATETIVRAGFGAGIEKAIHGTGAKWDYKSVSARSGDDVIDIAYNPAGGRQGYDWILSIADGENSVSKRVRDCTEVSDE